MFIIDKQVAIELFSQKDGWHFSHEGKDYCFTTREKVHEFFQKQMDIDTLKLCHGGKKSYVHFGMDDVEIYSSKRALQSTLSQEGGGTWIEERAGKRRFFIEEKGWLNTSFKEVSKKECIEKLESTSTLTKALGVAFGILALAPGVCEFARHIPKEAGLGLLALQQNSPLLGALGYSLLPEAADAQAMGTEFQVNTYTTNSQFFPSIAPLNDGGFVVTWGSFGQDGDFQGIYGQRYDAAGTTNGSEFQVNTYTTRSQELPSVAALNDGGFVVSWMSNSQDGDSWGIFGQRYDATGARAGTEFQVNTYTTNYQENPSVAPLNDGGFIVSWMSYPQDGDRFGIFGQRYNAFGARAGIEFQVNTYTTSDQRYPSVAPLNDGGFVVTWDSNGQDGGGYGIYGQRYNATSAPNDTEFQVNTYTTNNQDFPSIAPLSDGGFVVIWQSSGQDGGGYGIYGQRYNATSAPNGSEFQVNTYTTGNQLDPSIAPLNDEGFVVTWESLGQDGNLNGIYGQRYNAIGAPNGSEFQVNTYTTNNQQNPSLAPLNDGGFVIAWESHSQDGGTSGIYGQRYDSNGNPVSLTLQTPSRGLLSQMSTSVFQSNLTPSPPQVTSASSPNLDTNRISTQSILTSTQDLLTSTPSSISSASAFQSSLSPSPPQVTSASSPNLDTDRISTQSILTSTQDLLTSAPSSISSASAFQSSLTPSPSQIFSTSSPNLTTSGPSLTSSSATTNESGTQSSLISTQGLLTSTRSSTSGTTALSSNFNQSQPYTSNPESMRTLPGTSAISSTSRMPTPSGIIIDSVIDIVYGESYPIYVNGQIVGTYTISGGSGLLDSSNPNMITMHFNQSFAPEEEDEFIPLFSIPDGQATDWQSIQLGDTEFECLEARAEINPSTSGNAEFGLVFIGADSCTASGSQIAVGILPIIMN